MTQSGKRCKLHSTKNSDRCFIHTQKPAEYYCNECKRKAIIHGKCSYHYIYDENCPICFEEINHKNSKKLQCGHLFHVDCLDKWFEKNYTCPMCRTEVEEVKQIYMNKLVRRNLYELIFIDIVV